MLHSFTTVNVAVKLLFALLPPSAYVFVCSNIEVAVRTLGWYYYNYDFIVIFSPYPLLNW